MFSYLDYNQMDVKTLQLWIILFGGFLEWWISPNQVILHF